MKIVRAFATMCLLGFLSSCAGDAGTGDWFGKIAPGQWTTPTPMGGDKFLTEGYHTRNAITGATQFCSKQGKAYEVVDLTPSDSDSRATLIFKCV